MKTQTFFVAVVAILLLSRCNFEGRMGEQADALEISHSEVKVYLEAHPELYDFSQGTGSPFMMKEAHTSRFVL